MIKLRILSVLALVIISFTSCGNTTKQMTDQEVQALSKDMPYKITVTVDVVAHLDPEIFIKADEVEFNPNKREVRIKGVGYLANSDKSWSYAIKIEDAMISVPPAGKISIEKR